MLRGTTLSLSKRSADTSLSDAPWSMYAQYSTYRVTDAPWSMYAQYSTYRVTVLKCVMSLI